MIAKLDHGNVIVFGQADAAILTQWADLEGPVIGFHFEGGSISSLQDGQNLSIIVGDKCRPKYYGARKLPVRLGERREMKFYWQNDYP